MSGKNSLILLFFVLYNAVFAQVVPDFTASTTKICAPNSVTFTVNPDVVASTYLWEFSNGTTSNLKNPTIFFNSPGLISVKLTINQSGQQIVVNKRNFIRVFAPPLVDFTADNVLGCSPLSVLFTDLSVPNSANIESWFWSFGNGETSNEQYPSTVYTEKRNHTVVLKVVDQNGCEAIKVKNNFIGIGGPEANFTHNELLCRIPERVFFINQSKGNNLEYYWNFGDGNFSNAELPGSHLYTKFDSTFVQLVVKEKNSGCSDTIRKAMNIINYQATFDFSISCTQQDFSINLLNTTQPFANNLIWDLGDNSTSNLNALNKKYSNASPKKIILRAEINETCWDTTALNYTPSNPSFTAITEECNPPMIVTFENKSLGKGLTYLWNFNDTVYSPANSTEINPIKKFETPPDRHFVGLEATDIYGCKRSSFANINAPYPIAKFEAVNNKNTGCAPLTVNFLDTLSYILDSTTIASVYWNFGDPLSGNLNESFNFSPTHTFNEPGEYDITYAILLSNGCVDTITIEKFIKVGEKPDSVKVTSSLGDSICWGATPIYTSIAYKNNEIFTTNYHCWLFEKTDSTNLLNNSETPPSDCLNPQNSLNQFSKFMSSINFPNPPHQYIKYDYQNQNIINDKLILADALSHSGNKFTHLITGFNGCYTEVIKPKYIKDVMAMPGFVFEDKKQSLFFPDTSRSIKIFNASTNFKNLDNFKVYQNPEKIEVQNLALQDTSIIKFSQSGNYSIEITVSNDEQDCASTTVRNVIVENPDLKLKFEDNICYSNQFFYAIDQSKFNFGTTTNRRWWVNDSLLLNQENIGFIRKDSVQLHILDTGWNVVKLEIRRRYPEYLMGDILTFVEHNYLKVDSVYISGSKGTGLIDTNFICKGDSLLLVANFSSTHAIDSLVWDYGNNLRVNRLDNHFYQFTQSGIFALNFKVFNNLGCLDIINFDTLVVSGPDIDFLASDTLVCLNNEVNFKNLAKGNTLSYEWKTEDKIYFNIDITHQYKQVGFKEVELIATDKFGCKDSLTKNNYIEVAPIPNVKFGVDNILGNCPPFVVNFTDSTIGNTTKWLWDFGDNEISTIKNPLHTFTSPGKYSVELKITNYANCVNTLKMDTLITVLGPNGSVNIEKDKLCLPDSLILNGDFKDTKFFIWNFGNNDFRNFESEIDGDTIHYSYTKYGQYQPSVILIDNNNCKYSPSLNLNILVDSINAKMSINDTVLCSLKSFEVLNNSKIAYPKNISWDLGNGIALVGNKIELNYTQPGNYELKLNIESEAGCKDSIKTKVINYEEPVFNFEVETKDFCVPVQSLIKLNIISENFDWNSKTFEVNGQLYENEALVVVNEVQKINGQYELIYGNNQCVIDSVFSLQYYDYPIIDFNYSPNFNSVQSEPIQFNSIVQTQFSVEEYSWDFKNGSQSNLPNPVTVFKSQGEYDIELNVVNSGGCSNTISKKIIISPIDFVILPEAFTPNGDGIDDEFKVLYAGDIEFYSLKIFNRWGNMLFETNNINEGWNGTKNGKNEPNGSYVYLVEAKDKSGNDLNKKGNLALIR